MKYSFASLLPSTRVKPENLTPHFRNLIRETNPAFSVPEILAWSWAGPEQGAEFGQPLFRGNPLPFLHEIDSRYPGGEAVGLMFHAITAQPYELTHKATFRY